MAGLKDLRTLVEEGVVRLKDGAKLNKTPEQAAAEFFEKASATIINNSIPVLNEFMNDKRKKLEELKESMEKISQAQDRAVGMAKEQMEAVIKKANSELTTVADKMKQGLETTVVAGDGIIKQAKEDGLSTISTTVSDFQSNALGEIDRLKESVNAAIAEVGSTWIEDIDTKHEQAVNEITEVSGQVADNIRDFDDAVKREVTAVKSKIQDDIVEYILGNLFSLVWKGIKRIFKRK